VQGRNLNRQFGYRICRPSVFGAADDDGLNTYDFLLQ
jgi:hypothetical protein